MNDIRARTISAAVAVPRSAALRLDSRFILISFYFYQFSDARKDHALANIGNGHILSVGYGLLKREGVARASRRDPDDRHCERRRCLEHRAIE